MGKTGVTLITTVLNEQNSIHEFLLSCIKQSKKANEIIIVDAGSKDRTCEIIKQFIQSSRIPLKLVIEKGNRSHGRNTAVKLSNSEIIACSDVGCVLDSRWIERITAPFSNKNVDVVSGFYYPRVNSVLEKCVSAYTCVMPDRLNEETYLPSSRSIAFRKSAWEGVGGYPEELDTCEDLVFAKKLKRAKYKFKLVKNAVVLWPQKNNFLDIFRQLYEYAKGDGQALYFRVQTPILALRYLVLVLLIFTLQSQAILLILILLILFILYSLWAIKKNYRYINDLRALIILPLLQIIADIAVVLGMTVGLKKRVLG